MAKYYCENCEQEFEYNNEDQQTCEHCNRLIDDDQIVHVEEVA